MTVASGAIAATTISNEAMPSSGQRSMTARPTGTSRGPMIATSTASPVPAPRRAGAWRVMRRTGRGSSPAGRPLTRQ